MTGYNRLIREASLADAETILDIYKKYVEETSISFETQVPSVAEFRNRMNNIMNQFPYLVCEMDGKVVGYAYASKHRERAAYQWSADLSIYIEETYHRQHIATMLYDKLIDLLKIQGYYTAFAGVTSPNPNSEAFHEAYGFETVGVFHNVGYKLGQWRDVKWYSLQLTDYRELPTAPRSISDITDEDKEITP
ncbi:MAG: N-acetyltransferase [Lachnospiraceae bacterium]|nr:N-acetyltransferase [Lachnospiraceae bacterium]